MNDPTALAPIRLTGRYHECRTPLVDLIDRDELDRWNAANEASRAAYAVRFTRARVGAAIAGTGLTSTLRPSP